MMSNVSVEDVEREYLNYLLNTQYFMKHIAAQKRVWPFDEGVQGSRTFQVHFRGNFILPEKVKCSSV